MARNQKLTGVLKGRRIAGMQADEGHLRVQFDDGSIMAVKTGAPPQPAPAAGPGAPGPVQPVGRTIRAVRQQDTTLDLDLDDGSTWQITTAEATSSVMVRDKSHALEYAD